MVTGIGIPVALDRFKARTREIARRAKGVSCVTTPVDPRLPDGGGWDLCGIYQFTRGSRRLLLNVDLYNAFNSAWVYGQNGTLGTDYTIAGTWLRPSTVLQARMFKLGAQFDF